MDVTVHDARVIASPPLRPSQARCSHVSLHSFDPGNSQTITANHQKAKNGLADPRTTTSDEERARSLRGNREIPKAPR